VGHSNAMQPHNPQVLSGVTLLPMALVSSKVSYVLQFALGEILKSFELLFMQSVMQVVAQLPIAETNHPILGVRKCWCK
jgi:hypothetical protein